MSNWAVAGGPEFDVRFPVSGEPANKVLTGNVFVQPPLVIVIVPNSKNWPSEFAADWVRVAVRFAAPPGLTVRFTV